MYIANRLKFKEINYIHTNSENCLYEPLFVEVETEKNKTVIGVIYKPTDTCINTFNIQFNDLLGRISNERKKCILMADFNIDIDKSDTNHQTTYFIHNMFANAFYPTISKPTRITQQTATLIDNIITNIHEYSIKYGILYNDISDLFPIFTFYELRMKRENEHNFFLQKHG